MKRWRVAMILGTAAALAVGCGTDQSGSLEVGWTVFVQQAEIDDAGQTDNFGDAAEVDLVRNTCSSGEPEIFTGASVILTLQAQTVGGRFESRGGEGFEDKPSELEVGLRVGITSVVIEYTAIDSADPNNPNAIIALDTVVLDYAPGEKEIDLSAGNATYELVVPLMDIRKKDEFNTKATQLFGSLTNQQNAGQGPYAYPKYKVTYTLYLRDNYGHESSTSYSGVMWVGDWDRC